MQVLEEGEMPEERLVQVAVFDLDEFLEKLEEFNLNALYVKYPWDLQASQGMVVKMSTTAAPQGAGTPSVMWPALLIKWESIWDAWKDRPTHATRRLTLPVCIVSVTSLWC